MIRSIVVLFVLVIVAFGIYFLVLKEAGISEGPLPVSSVHYFKKQDIPLDNIRVKAFYFIPKNKTEYIFPGWESVLNNALEELSAFHLAVFGGLSQVSFDVFKEPVIGFEENLFYDTEITDRGNPHALRNIYWEMEERALKPSGDLYDEDFLKSRENEYVVYYFIYEGVGGSGSEDVALISRDFLTNDEYKDVGTSIFYHEFAHTLGIPDHYDEDGNYFSFDIMGFGLKRPLVFNYLDQSILRNMGF
jgi:hypothetical protein